MADDPIRLAVAQAKAGNKNEARKTISRVLRSDPDNVRAWIVMAQVVKERDKAIDCLENILRIDPDHPWAALHLSRLRNPGITAPPSSSMAPAPSAPRDLNSLDELFPSTGPALADMDTTELELDLEDLGIGEVIRPAGVEARTSELDPFAGGGQWTDMQDEGGRYTYDEVREQIERDIRPPAKKSRRVPWLLFIAIFLIFMVLAFIGAAWALGMLPF